MGSETRLRREVYRSDIEQIIRWLQDEKVREFLNEDQNIGERLQRMVAKSTLPIFTPQLNRDGTFFMITIPQDGPIGFLRLISKSGESAEIVIVIGERDQWGRGYGYRAILKGVKHALFEWRKKRVIAKIDKENERSKAVFRKAGFKKVSDLEREQKFVVSPELLNS